MSKPPPVVLIRGEAVFDYDVPAFLIASLLQTFTEGRKQMRIRVGCSAGEEADHWQGG